MSASVGSSAVSSITALQGQIEVDRDCEVSAAAVIIKAIYSRYLSSRENPILKEMTRQASNSQHAPRHESS